jgi:hypothetical protein
MHITNSQLTSIQKKFNKITFPNNGKVMINQDLGLMSFEVDAFTKDIYIFVELDSYQHFYKDICRSCPNYPSICGGIYTINKPIECLIAPQEVADLWDEEEDIDDCLFLKIPDQTFIIDFSNYEIKCYMEIYDIHNILFGTALPFTNIGLEGYLCFGENLFDVANDINSGRFNSIVEVFWASEFNHDLAADTLLLNDTPSYTSKFHMELRTFLLNHFSPSKTNKEIVESLKKIDPYSICFGDTIYWKCYSTYDNSFYILSLEKYIVVLVINPINNFMKIFKFKKL